MGVQTTQRVAERRKRSRPISDINVTPFVDVMLVLLVVFMVTAPLLVLGIPVQLPKVSKEYIIDDDSVNLITVHKNLLSHCNINNEISNYDFLKYKIDNHFVPN